MQKEASGGKVHSFGDGAYGRLGHGVRSNEMVPRWIKGLDGARVVAVAAGRMHSMALTADGKVYTWGYGFLGQLGHNGRGNRFVPTEVATLSGVCTGS